MVKVIQVAINCRIWKDRRGQDSVEYALMAGFVAVTAAALLPDITNGLTWILSKVNSLMIDAASGDHSHYV